VINYPAKLTLSLNYMNNNSVTIPKRFKQRYLPLVDDPEAFFSSLLKPLPKSFRVNVLKATQEDVVERFRSYGMIVKQMLWYADAFVVESGSIGSTLERFLGKINLQELASMLPPLLVRKELISARSVLDACAAPGSKTTQLAALMRNKGLLIANDSNFSRIRALKFNLNKAGALNVVITNRDLRNFPLSQFDVILLDAPCSSEGTTRKNPFLLSRWSEHRIRTCAGLQKQLILRAFDLLAPGGTLVYSTCTFAPEENEAVVDWLLQNRPAKLLPIDLPNIKLAPPVREWQATTFHHEIDKVARLWPHHNDTGGFFLARVGK